MRQVGSMIVKIDANKFETSESQHTCPAEMQDGRLADV